MRTYLPLGAALTVVVAAGLVRGYWTDRWRPSAELGQALARLGRLHPLLDDWHGKDLELDARQVRRAGAAGYFLRAYTREGDKARASVLLMCGRSGPMSVHAPDVCYPGAGFEMVDKAPTRCKVPAGLGSREAQFWTARFRGADSVVPVYLRLYWAWSVPGGTWKAPDNPRWTFGRRPALYKLYVIRPMASPEETPEGDPAVGLVQRFLADLDAAGNRPRAAAPSGRPAQPR
jgi:hypothetical protein